MPKIPHLSPQDENKILGMAAPALLPLLGRKRDNLINRILGEYRQGAQDFRPSIAELITITDLIRDLEIKLNAYDRGE